MRVRSVPTAGLLASTLLLGLLAAWPSGAALAQRPVDLELVLAVDISGSVDEEEAALQRDGYVTALTDDRVVSAMGGGPFGAVAVTYVEWAGEDYQRIVVPWTLIGNREEARKFSDAIGTAPLSTARWTSLSGAIDHAATLFEGNGFEGVRQVIDISGDGVNNRGRPPSLARDEAVAAGITINGLPILNDRPNPWGGPAPIDLDRYYEENVIGGPGAFYIAARDFDDFAAAILSKLIREIAGVGSGAG
ncbi:DUF1194 domain-containing protein [Skermanella mucosa]|uniref:DUF1194 domain-containing protein n=1 Tax=Skermanella mucosa TaxID=1789672 RepID=UPI00192B794A|nr:DUF1194 domain-containing protein [Skermanella mucosa]UEM18629.1 DUF1194 domain-containing protein [Skermanella mucosa]